MTVFYREDDNGYWTFFTRYEKAGEGRRITLIPEMHYFDRAFGREYWREYARHDLVFEEYVPIPRWIKAFATVIVNLTWALGLHQRRSEWAFWRDPPRRRGISFHAEGRTKTVPVEIADLDRPTYRALYKAKPWRERTLGPFIRMVRDDDCNDADAQVDSESPGFARLALTAERDAYLRGRILSWLDAPASRNTDLAIRYGAGHMPMIHRMLLACGWEVADRRAVLCKASRKCALSNAARGCDYRCGDKPETMRGHVEPASLADGELTEPRVRSGALVETSRWIGIHQNEVFVRTTDISQWEQAGDDHWRAHDAPSGAPLSDDTLSDT